LVPPSRKASADECSEGRSECLLFWGSVEVFLRRARRSFMRRRVFLGLLFGLRFVQRVLTLRCALSQCSRIKSIFIFYYFASGSPKATSGRLNRWNVEAQRKRRTGHEGEVLVRRCPWSQL